MKLTIESTPKIVTLEIGGVDVPARLWQGESAEGVPVQVFITRLAPEIPQDDPRQRAFQLDLQEHAAPRTTIREIPLRLIL